MPINNPNSRYGNTDNVVLVVENGPDSACAPPSQMLICWAHFERAQNQRKLGWFKAVAAQSYFIISLFLLSASGQPTLLPPDHVQELNLRSTGMLNNMQRLFSHHMIQTFGCDYSTSGVTMEAVQNKLRNFMELRTADGPRHDTYLIFYSGHTQRASGAWVLAGECHILIILFYIFGKRVILIVETFDSFAHHIRHHKGCCDDKTLLMKKISTLAWCTPEQSLIEGSDVLMPSPHVTESFDTPGFFVFFR